jgi:viologen exporter family transport system permease protein
MRVLEDKYLAVFITQVKNLFEYKVNILLKLVRPFVMTAALGSLWWVLFRVTGKETIGGFTKVSFITYLLTIRFIAIFSPGSASIFQMNDEIRTGNFTMRLVRPINYLWWLFCRNLPMPLFCGSVGLCIVGVISMFMKVTIPTGWNMVLFILSVAGTIIVQYACYQGIGILSFWIYEIFPVERFFKTISSMLSGEVIPLTLFGVTARTVIQFLPFATLAFIPGGIYVGLFPLREAALLVLSQYVWAMVLWSIVICLYKRGVRKFEAQGG